MIVFQHQILLAHLVPQRWRARQVAHLWEFARNVLMWEFLFQGLQMMVCRHVHLETQSAASMALKSPHEYHQRLLSYIWFLARLVSMYMDC